jgi:L-ascorbate metabolism protein UlaG (beta-lactamase superfamily)
MAEGEPTGAAAPGTGRAEEAGVESSLRFIGTATVLVQLGPFRFLTDPNFLHQGDHAPLGFGLRTRRLTEPAMTIEELPELDLIVLSHHHGDHFDDIAARDLPKEVPIVTNEHARRKLERQGFTEAIALETWRAHTVERDGYRLRITALPGKHAPQPLQALLPPVMGSMVDLHVGDEEAPRFRLYISGDTLFYDELASIREHFPDIDLAVIHLGGTRVLGVLLTMDAEQGVELLRLLEPAAAVPVHYDDYTVFRSPLEDFRVAAERAGLAVDIHYLDRGESFSFALGPPR